MFKTLTPFRIEKFNLSGDQLSEKLKTLQFNHCDSSVLLSYGFCPVVDGDDSLVRKIGDGFLLSFRIEKKLLPASVVREFIKERVLKFVAAQGRKPKRAEKKEIKENVIASLIPKAFGVSKDTFIWIDINNQLVHVNSASKSTVGLLITALFKCVATDVEFHPISTKISPIKVMTYWLVSGNVPSEFTIDRDCLLKNSKSNASLRFSQQSLQEHVVNHIKEGQLPNELSLTWNDRVSFTLCADMSIKKIKFLEIVTEDKETITDDDLAALDAEVILDMSELMKLLPTLIKIMGGDDKEQTSKT